MRLKKSKHLFMQKSVQYLGYVVDAVGIHATNAKLKARSSSEECDRTTIISWSYQLLRTFYSKLVFVTSSLSKPDGIN